MCAASLLVRVMNSVRSWRGLRAWGLASLAPSEVGDEERASSHRTRTPTAQQGYNLDVRMFFGVGGATAVLVALLPADCGSPEEDEASRGPGGTERQGSSAAAPDDVPPARAEREFETGFGKHSVSYEEIRSGGPPKDGIPAIGEPRSVGVEEAEEGLGPRQPVILLRVGDEARAYPIRVVTWHEIVNDRVNGTPVVVTFCPLCNTAIAFEGTLDGGRRSLRRGDRQLTERPRRSRGRGTGGEPAGARRGEHRPLLVLLGRFRPETRIYEPQDTR